MLVLLWLMQIVYLDTFYKSIKRNKLEKASEYLMDSLDSEYMEDIVDEIAVKYDICISIRNTDGAELYSAEYNPLCRIHNISYEVFKEYYQAAQEAGGSKEIEFEGDENKTFPSMNVPPLYNQKNWENIQKPKNIEPRERMAESVVSITITSVNGEEWIVMLNSLLTPVDATVETLQVQLIYISVIMITLSLLIAFLMSKKIAVPIIKINDSAKELSKGIFNVEFNGKGYLEISELSDTLNYTAKELGKAEGLQRELIANVSHDLRTPLTMIIAYAEVMRDLPGENTPENIQIVIDESKRLGNLVNDMLDISKLQAGVVKKDIRRYDLTKSIQEVLERYGKLKEQDGYRLIFNYDENVFVEADEFKIFQVIYNLINNAINYTGEDKIIIVNQIVKGSIVRIEVIDSGEGIPQSQLSLVWERYYKADKPHKRAISGTGLGLSIVKNILELHEAQFGVISKDKEGSTFWFELKR